LENRDVCVCLDAFQIDKDSANHGPCDIFISISWRGDNGGALPTLPIRKKTGAFDAISINSCPKVTREN
jgi:hypothetical protein